jgi:type VI secretion system protein ImpJ
VDQHQKVLWTEGMFLGPQHLQQSDRYHEEQLRRAVKSLRDFSWGVQALQVNADALANGEFVLARCAAVLPDGLAVDVPDSDAAPSSRPIEGAFDAKRSTLGVYLAAPQARPGYPAASPEGAADGRPTRYRLRTSSVPDDNAGGAERDVALAARNLRILFEGEALEDASALKIAEIGRSATGKFQLSDGFIPPSLCVSASPALATILRRVLEILSAKSEELAKQRRERSKGLVEFTMSEAANFWFLHTVNAFIPALAHHHHHPSGHPEAVYLELAKLAGELTTFATDGHPKDLPRYEHDDLRGTFSGLEARIRALMETIIPSKCSPVPLEKLRETLFTGRLADERLLDGGGLYLAVMCGVPEEKVIREIPLKAKASAADRVDQIIAAALRGLVLRHLPTPPAEIPVQPGRVYFQIDKSGDHWEAVRKSRSISFYVPPEFTQLRLELMAVKE